jgi:hypothetical protein
MFVQHLGTTMTRTLGDISRGLEQGFNWLVDNIPAIGDDEKFDQ